MKNSGFSLIQLSVLLAVSSIIIVSILPGGDSGSEKAKQQITLQRMAAIEEATKAFMAKNLRRPCPADGSAPYNTGEGLIEQCPPDKTPPFSSADVDSYAGTVPTLTLGLPPEMGLDGYGRRMMYVVDKRVTSSNSTSDTNITTCQDMVSLNQTGAIEIASDYFIPASDNTMWALISYGKDGHGTFPIGGSGIKFRLDLAPTDTATIYNAFKVDDVMAYGTPVDPGINTTTKVGGRLIQKPATSTFDDIVWYAQETKNTCMLGATTSSFNFRITGLGTTGTLDTNSVVTASGDINGDGIEDLVVGIPSIPKVHVIYGKKYTWSTSVSTEFNITSRAVEPTGFTISSSDSPWLGRTIAVGDVNGDSFDDIVLGSDKDIFIVFGETTKTSSLTLTRSSGSIASESEYSVITFGSCPSANTCPGEIAIGNVSGDGINDIVFATSRNGATDTTTQVYTVFGRGPSTTVLDISAMTASEGFAITTDSSNEFANGYRTISIGDFNQDASKDILFGGKNDNNAYLVFGSTTTIPLNTAVTSATSGIRFSLTGTGFGRAVALKDINNDGMDDAIIANDTNVYIYYGRNSGITTPVTSSGDFDVRIAVSGIDAISTTDLNNDGLPDLVFGASTNSSNLGIVYVFMQPTSGYAPSYTITSGSRPSGVISFSGSPPVSGVLNPLVHTATTLDLNGDGKNDLAIAEPGVSGGALNIILGRSNAVWDSNFALGSR
jgi:type II secretory pathway pseudopilin PulG